MTSVSREPRPGDRIVEKFEGVVTGVSSNGQIHYRTPGTYGSWDGRSTHSKSTVEIFPPEEPDVVKRAREAADHVFRCEDVFALCDAYMELLSNQEER